MQTQTVNLNDDDVADIIRFIDDKIDEAIVRERATVCDIDDDDNLIDEEDILKELGITKEKIDSYGEIRFE